MEFAIRLFLAIFDETKYYLMQGKQINDYPIDSLNDKINSINHLVIDLKKHNHILSDSIKNLNDIIIRADIKTEFYSDQLNSQLFWFSLILALIGVVSWKTFVTPIIKKLDNITLVKIPEFEKKLNENLENSIEKFEDNVHDLQRKTSEAISWGLRSSRNFYQKEERWEIAVLFAIRHIDLYFIDDVIDNKLDDFLEELKSVYNLINAKKDVINNFGGFEDEILTIINKVKIEESSPEINDLGFKISEIFHSIIKQPETGLEADPHEAPSK